MTKYRIVTAAAAPGLMTALDTLARSERIRAGLIGSRIGLRSPSTWNGTGAIPPGWTLPYAAIFEAGGGRVALVGTEAFASGKGQFTGAVDELPADWS